MCGPHFRCQHGPNSSSLSIRRGWVGVLRPGHPLSPSWLLIQVHSVQRCGCYLSALSTCLPASLALYLAIIPALSSDHEEGRIDKHYLGYRCLSIYHFSPPSQVLSQLPMAPDPGETLFLAEQSPLPPAPLLPPSLTNGSIVPTAKPAPTLIKVLSA